VLVRQSVGWADLDAYVVVIRKRREADRGRIGGVAGARVGGRRGQGEAMV